MVIGTNQLTISRAITLVINVWNWQCHCLDMYAKWFEMIAKLSAFVFPAIMAGLRQVFQLNAGFVGTLILVNFIRVFLRGSSSSECQADTL